MIITTKIPNSKHFAKSFKKVECGTDYDIYEDLKGTRIKVTNKRDTIRGNIEKVDAVKIAVCNAEISRRVMQRREKLGY